MASNNGLEENFIPGLGYTRSYANVNSTPVTTAPIDPAVPSFQKSLIGSEINRVLEAKAKAGPGFKEVGPAEDELSEDDDNQDGGSDAMAEPSSKRTKKVTDTEGQADTEMAEPNSKRVPKLKPSDAPKAVDHPGFPSSGADKSDVEPYDRDTRVFLAKSQVAGTIRRIGQVDGVLEYVVAGDNGAMLRVNHDDITLMNTADASRR